MNTQNNDKQIIKVTVDIVSVCEYSFSFVGLIAYTDILIWGCER